jgi:hypothetical protein
VVLYVRLEGLRVYGRHEEMVKHPGLRIAVVLARCSPMSR